MFGSAPSQATSAANVSQPQPGHGEPEYLVHRTCQGKVIATPTDLKHQRRLEKKQFQNFMEQVAFTSAAEGQTKLKEMLREEKRVAPKKEKTVIKAKEIKCVSHAGLNQSTQ